MNLNDTMCNITQFAPLHHRLDGWWCFLLDGALAPSKVVCHSSAHADHWMSRVWNCHADRAYIFHVQLVCDEQDCPAPSMCTAMYDLSDTVLGTIACAVFLLSLAVVGMALYYMVMLRPLHVRLPYLVTSSQRPELDMKSINDFRVQMFGREHAT